MSEAAGKTDGSPIARFYNYLAPVYSWLRGFGHRRDVGNKDFLIERLAPFQDDIVLDVGTGPGIYALDIAAMDAGSRVIGIDISSAFVNIARKRAREAGAMNLEFAQGDISKLGFEDSFFTKIICAGVISVLDDRDKAVGELARVLRPGGKLSVRDPLRSDGPLTSWGRRLPAGSRRRVFLSRFGLMFGHFSPDFLSEWEFRSLFERAEFSKTDFEKRGSDIMVVATK